MTPFRIWRYYIVSKLIQKFCKVGHVLCQNCEIKKKGGGNQEKGASRVLKPWIVILAILLNPSINIITYPGNVEIFVISISQRGKDSQGDGHT